MTLSYLSICSGIEAATVAWRPLGWRALGFSEVAAFPSQVLKYHYPEVSNFGDFTQIQRADLAETPDILVGGTPCQDFSIAGNRLGMAGERGNLAIEYIRLVARIWPTWLVWENVPGVLSANDGRAFGTFLGQLEELGYGFAYRVLNAKYFGVPQERRRVFLVGHIRDWRLAAAVLFDEESLQWDAATHRDLGFFSASRAAATSEKDTVIGSTGGYSRTLTAGGQMRICTRTETQVMYPNREGSNLIRRLTPLEQERLQGFPDGYTDIGAGATDQKRGKALGNSMAVPCIKWIGERLAQVHNFDLLRQEI